MGRTKQEKGGRDGVMALLREQAEGLPEPDNLFVGADSEVLVNARNVVVFLRKSRRNLQRRSFASRSHHRHVLMLVLESSGVVSLDGGSYRVAPGQAMVFLPFQFHHYLNLEKDELRWLFITFECGSGESPLADLRSRVLTVSEEVAEGVCEVLRLWQGGADAASRGLLLQATLSLLLSRLLSQAGEGFRGGHSPAGSGSSWAFLAEREIQRAALEGRTLRDVAVRLGISERRLRSRFEEETGVGIRPYRANFLLHRAVALMRDSTLSLGEIAGQVGFQTPQAFHRFMVRESGMAPREYRRLVFPRG